MDLFSSTIDKNKNFLPYDGTVHYFGQLFPVAKANSYFEALINTIEWKNDEAFIMGKHIITKRKVAWYGDDEYAYTYSRSTKYALPWTKELLELRNIAEEHTGSTYNSCLLNLYHDGNEGMATTAMMRRPSAKVPALHR